MLVVEVEVLEIPHLIKVEMVQLVMEKLVEEMVVLQMAAQTKMDLMQQQILVLVVEELLVELSM
jgi:hypothetical protein